MSHWLHTSELVCEIQLVYLTPAYIDHAELERFAEENRRLRALCAEHHIGLL